MTQKTESEKKQLNANILKACVSKNTEHVDTKMSTWETNVGKNLLERHVCDFPLMVIADNALTSHFT